MKRVETLLKKLQQQLTENAPVQAMLHTVQILQAELIGKFEKKTILENQKVSVIMPTVFDMQAVNNENLLDKDGGEEKIIEILQVDEKEIEEELLQIKMKADAVNAMVSHRNPPLTYDPIEEVPTLSHQDLSQGKNSIMNELPFEYPESLNDRFKEEKIEISQSLTTSPIKDLKKAIGVNDRFLFINELFRGDEAMYERSIKTIQNFSIFAEAEYWIRRELKLKIGWLDTDPVAKQFEQLIRRRFS